ncbi:superfamily II DNA/RNA helicase [Kribbella sp. VKM Ac-2527]|uniref:Superfamily II DNA/RNA helicase n=1 Tax=Kribbella caucasensis TaxID=2512215 RepID=A0A4R6KPT4_9ACTN|nr:DEAD/DEAH box helicase [Kribbella sp. VKM Ac-2527]TDO54695.1 superfamily II DNA/RNA helicase [Kribbella sp. VKM Ac-2527]
MAVSRPTSTSDSHRAPETPARSRRRRRSGAPGNNSAQAANPAQGSTVQAQNTTQGKNAAQGNDLAQRDGRRTDGGRRRRSRTTTADRAASAATTSEVTTSAEAYDDVVALEVPEDLTFADVGVPAELVEALAANGVTKPFPIQAATLPDSLAGKDVLGRGRTGSGKTYAFVLPVLARLAASNQKRRPNQPRALILAPTRELATQIQASITPLTDAFGLRTMTIFGGVGHAPQITGLRKGVDIVVACPGRLEDHVKAGHAKLDAVEITVLDEADHMADLGFLPAVRRILAATPERAQRLLFSATLDAGVDVLVQRFMHNPVTHSVDSAQSPVSKMTHHVLHVQPDGRLPVLVDLTAAPGRTLVFTRTKYGAKALTKKLISQGVPAVELHGNLSQGARTRNLEAFSDGSANTLVATDIAARGIHVDDVSLVIHADPPIEHKAYLHRSGRTARAGAEGTVVTLMTDDQVRDVRDLTRKAGIAPTVTKLVIGDPLLTELAPGERSFVEPQVKPAGEVQSVRRTAGAGGSSGGGRGRRGRGSGSGQGAGRASGGGQSAGRGPAVAPGRGSTGGQGSGRGSGGGQGSGRGSGKGGQARGGNRGGSGGGSGLSYSTTTPGSNSRPAGAAAFSAGSRAGASRRGR